MKKAVMFFLFMSISAVLFCTSVAAKAVSNTKYDFVVDLLTETGILDEQFSNVNTPESYISADVFNDALAHFSNGSLETVDGGSRIISVDEAIQAVLNSMVYTADNNDVKTKLGWDIKKKLLEDVIISDKLTARDFVQLFFNALYAEPVIGADPSGNVSYGKSYAETKEIERYKGIIQANSRTSLTVNDGLGEGRIMIGDKLFNGADPELENCLGMEVEVFSIDYSIITARETDNNKELFITSEDIDEVSANSIKYYIGDKSKKASLNNDYVQIYNGSLKLKKDLDVLNSGLLRIRLISNDGDDKYDVVFIEDLSVYRVGGVDRENMIITDETGTYREDFSDMLCSVSDGSMLMSFSDIKIGDVIYIGVDIARKNAVIYVSSDSVSGTCERVGYDDKCVINGVEYSISPAAAESVQAGQDGTFYLGAFGRIEFVKNKNTGFYGLAYGLFYDEDDETYKVKIVNQEQKNITLKLSKNAKFYMENINGQKLNDQMIMRLESYINRSMSVGSTEYGYGMAAPIVMYKETDGEIRSISLPVLFDENKYGSSRENNILQSAASQSGLLYVKSENMFLKSRRSFNPSYRNTKYSDGAQKYVDSNTIVFNIEITEQGAVTKDSIIDATVTTGDKGNYDATWIYSNFYNLSDSNVAEVMVKYDTSADLTNIVSNLTIVDKINQANSAAGETGYLIKGFNKGKAVEYFVKDDAVVQTNFLKGFLDSVPNLKLEDLGKGDLLSLAEDATGDIGYVSVMFLGRKKTEEYNRYHGTGNCESGREVMFGTVVKLTGDTMVLQLDSNANNSTLKRFCVKNYKSASIYSEKDKDVVCANPADILVGDNVYVRLKESVPMEIIIR